MTEIDRILESANYIKNKLGSFTEGLNTAIVLGSGLGDFVDNVEVIQTIDYKEIPNFPTSKVKGHKGRLIFGKCKGNKILCMQGRFHYYEGHPQKDVVLPIRVIGKLGIKNLILTNAAGGTNPDFNVPSLMIINDHINFSGYNPLIGDNIEELGPRFPDMSNIYYNDLTEMLKLTAKDSKIDVREGVYMYFSGPSYETPAEIKMARLLGADAVGMSTVPEAIAARHMNIKVCAVSCITNHAAGVSKSNLNHEEVLEASEQIKDTFNRLILNFVENIGGLDE